MKPLLHATSLTKKDSAKYASGSRSSCLICSQSENTTAHLSHLKVVCYCATWREISEAAEWHEQISTEAGTHAL